MLDVRRLRLLRELAHRGTIAAVAQALSFSPSAISQQLSALETDVGQKLTEPVGRGLRLTAQGELLVRHTEIVLAELERAEAALASSAGVVAGTLRVAAFQTAVVALIPSALTTLAAAHPALRIEVTELEPEDSIPALLAREFDVVLGEEYPSAPPAHRPELELRPLLRDRLRLVVPAGWGAHDLESVADRPWVMEPAGTTARAWSASICRRAGFEPDVRFTTSDLLLHLHLVEEGLAAALLPDLAGAVSRGPRGSRGSRARIRTHDLEGDPERSVFSVVRRGAAQHPAITAFEDAIRAR